MAKLFSSVPRLVLRKDWPVCARQATIASSSWVVHSQRPPASRDLPLRRANPSCYAIPTKQEEVPGFSQGSRGQRAPADPSFTRFLPFLHSLSAQVPQAVQTKYQTYTLNQNILPRRKTSVRISLRFANGYLLSASSLGLALHTGMHPWYLCVCSNHCFFKPKSHWSGLTWQSYLSSFPSFRDAVCKFSIIL